MRELKSFIVRYNGKFIRAYDEYEADKVIARLKHKRCLAMAKMCERSMMIAFMRDFYAKWHKRWLKIGQQFKEAK